MATRTDKEEDVKTEGGRVVVCEVCGASLNSNGECPNCGTKEGFPNNPGISAEEKGGLDIHDEVIKSFTSIEGVGEAKAEILFQHGFRTFEDIKNAGVEELSAIEGIGEKLAGTICEAVTKLLSEKKSQESSRKKGNDALKRWISGGADDGALTVWLGGDMPEPGSEPKAEGEEDPSMEALKKWLTGEEDALSEWLGESEEEARPAAIVSDELEAKEIELEEKERQLKALENEIQSRMVKVEELKKTLMRELEKIETGNFNPMKLIEETAEISKDLQTEKRKRKELEEEIEHIKKGTAAVVKYMKAQLMKSGSPAIRKKLAQEQAERKKLEIEVKNLREHLAEIQAQLDGKLKELPKDAQALKKKELELIEREKELQSLSEQLKEQEKALKSGEFAPSVEIPEEELQNRLQAELREKEKEFLEKEAELKKKIIALEEEIQKYRIEEKQRRESQELRKLSAPEIEEVLAEKERQLQMKEKSILIREEEIERLKEELKDKEEELQKLKEPLSYKEEELLRREEDILYREKKLAAERRKLEEAKKAGGTLEEMELKQRLEELKAEIQRKEDEVRAKEKYLKAKMEELRLREQGLIEEEIQAAEEERALEISQEKVKTGIPRLDDLLLGGIPFGSNVQIYGPPFVGKEIFVNSFIAAGLKKGIPAIWVITDKMPSDIREEMQFVVSGYEEYERLGLVRYVDAYSKSMGEVEEDPYTVYIADPTDYEGILTAVDDIAKEFKKKHDYYRLAFRSVSTLVAYLDTTTTFKFLQSFAGRRKRDRAVSMYMIEKGMHGDQEIQMIGSMMDGMIDFKVEQLKTFLSVKGICDVQSRAWIKYSYSKSGVSIGSFSLDHIR